MKLRIRQPDFLYSVQIKQLPSKEVFLFTMNKNSKYFILPLKIAELPLITPEESPERIFALIYDSNTEYNYDGPKKFIESIEQEKYSIETRYTQITQRQVEIEQAL